MGEYQVLESWKDDYGASFEYRYYEAHPNFDNERTLMLVVGNHGIVDHTEQDYMAATSFSQDFGKQIGPEIVKGTKGMLVKSYEYARDKDAFDAERRQRREKGIRQQQGLDKMKDV